MRLVEYLKELLRRRYEKGNFFTVWLFVTFLFAQNPERVVYNTSNTGLLYNTVYTIVIDESGNKWIGTWLGLSKFDGVRWTVYNSSNSGLPFNVVRSIVKDDSSNIWIGINGLVKFDGINWTVYNALNSGLPNDFIYAIDIDDAGNKWIGTYEGGIAVYREGGVVKIDEKYGNVPVFV